MRTWRLYVLVAALTPSIATIAYAQELPLLGEPYQLAGKRIVFTDWSFVRPGDVGWAAPDGGALPEDADPNLGRFNPGRFIPHGIRIRAQQAEQRGPILQPDRLWEQWDVAIVSMLKDGSIYKAWGRTAPSREYAPWDKHLPCYFESKDGVHWERPNLGIRDWQGSKENNLLGEDAYDVIKGTVFIDPSAPQQERYKVISTEKITRAEFEKFKAKYPDRWESRADRGFEVTAVVGSVSADGRNWTPLPEPLVVEHCDTHAVGVWDPLLKKYVAYFRTWMVPNRAKGYPGYVPADWIGPGRRAISRTESDDFRQFPLSKPVMVPAPDLLPSDSLYQNGYCTIPEAPECRLLFPDIWHQHNDTVDIGIAASYDGYVWNFIPGSPVIHTRAFGQYDGGAIFGSPSLIECASGDFAMAYTGYNVPHKYPRGQYKQLTGYAVWPHGRIVALEAQDVGEFQTLCVIPPGTKLYLNARTKRAGGIQVAALRYHGGVIEGRTLDDCETIIGDHPRVQVRWKGGDDLGIQPGEPVALQFKMTQAELFSLEFE